MDWAAVIRRASTVTEVLEVLDEFTSSLPDAYWNSVPEGLRRPAIAAEADLERWHQALVKHLAETPVPGKPLQELCRVSLHAAARVHQLRLQPDRRDDGSTNDNKFSAGPDSRRCA